MERRNIERNGIGWHRIVQETGCPRGVNGHMRGTGKCVDSRSVLLGSNPHSTIFRQDT